MVADGTSDPTGSVLAGRFVLRGVLGVGGMAEVHRALDRTTGREVALKVLRPVPAEESDRERLRSEARVLAALDHPGVVRILDAGIADGRPWLAMEQVSRSTLKDVCLAAGALAPARVARIGAQVAEALEHVHAAGVVHRDVKPSNVLLGEGDRTWVADFGIARSGGDDAGLTRTGTTVGSPAYLSPEQVRGTTTIAPASDVYALGLLLVECLTGTRCFPGPPVEAALARLTRAPEIPADLGATWVDLLRTMTAIDPGTRPTAGEVGRRLRRLEAHETRTVPVADLTGTTSWESLLAESTSEALALGALPVVGLGTYAAPASTPVPTPGRPVLPEPVAVPPTEPVPAGASRWRGALVAAVAVAAVGVAAVGALSLVDSSDGAPGTRPAPVPTTAVPVAGADPTPTTGGGSGTGGSTVAPATLAPVATATTTGPSATDVVVGTEGLGTPGGAAGARGGGPGATGPGGSGPGGTGAGGSGPADGAAGNPGGTGAGSGPGTGSGTGSGGGSGGGTGSGPADGRGGSGGSGGSGSSDSGAGGSGGSDGLVADPGAGAVVGPGGSTETGPGSGSR